MIRKKFKNDLFTKLTSSMETYTYNIMFIFFRYGTFVFVDDDNTRASARTRVFEIKIDFSFPVAILDRDQNDGVVHYRRSPSRHVQPASLEVRIPPPPPRIMFVAARRSPRGHAVPP